MSQVVSLQTAHSWELNRPVICLLFGARGVTQQIKSPRTASDYRFRRPAPLTLSTARRGCAHTINCASWVRSDYQLLSYPIHFFNRIQQRRKPSGASCMTKSSWKEPRRLTTISSAASVIGQLANFVVAVDILRPAQGGITS